MSEAAVQPAPTVSEDDRLHRRRSAWRELPGQQHEFDARCSPPIDQAPVALMLEPVRPVGGPDGLRAGEGDVMP